MHRTSFRIKNAIQRVQRLYTRMNPATSLHVPLLIVPRSGSRVGGVGRKRLPRKRGPMVPESIFCTAALRMHLLALPSRSSTRETLVLLEAGPSAFRTDRLSPRQIKLWNAIRKIALARNPHGAPLYPTLDGLWRSVGTWSSSNWSPKRRGPTAVCRQVLRMCPTRCPAAQATLPVAQ